MQSDQTVATSDACTVTELSGFTSSRLNTALRITWSIARARPQRVVRAAITSKACIECLRSLCCSTETADSITRRTFRRDH
jgi:hypothetical protein